MSSKAVIVADRPFGNAISRVLEIFSINSVCMPRQMIEDLAANCPVWNWPSSQKSAKDALYECSLVLAVDSGRRGPSDILALVHLLRGRWLGDARFIALLHSGEERKQIVECDLFGDPSGAFSFGKIGGHSALLLPINLVDVLQEIESAELAEQRMTASRWMIECADQATASRVVQNLKMLKAMDWERNPELAFEQARDLMRNLHAARWDAQLFPNDHNTGPELARRFLNEFPATRDLRLEDLKMICEMADQIMNMSVFGSLNAQRT